MWLSMVHGKTELSSATEPMVQVRNRFYFGQHMDTFATFKLPTE